MKKTLISLAFVSIFFAPITQAATLQELENQQIQLLEQIIVLLKARLSELVTIRNSTFPTQTVGASLSLNTGENVSTTPAKPVKKKRSGGGGGSSRKSAPEQVEQLSGFAPFVTDFSMGSTEFNFEVPAHVFFAPESITTVLDLHDVPWWFTLPTTFTIKVPLTDGSVSDVVMVLEKGGKYVADMNPTLHGGKQYVPDLAKIINETVKILGIPLVVMDKESIIVDIFPDYSEYIDATLELDASYEDPDASTFVMEEDALYPIFAFRVGVVEEGAHIALEEIIVDIAITGVEDIEDIVDEFLLEINGEIYEANINDVTPKSATLSFYLYDEVEMDNNDLTDNAQSALTGMVYVLFDDVDEEDLEGATIRASLAPEKIYGTHVMYTGEKVYGNVHTFHSSDSVEFFADYVDSSAKTLANGSGEYRIEFEATVSGGDMLLYRSFQAITFVDKDGNEAKGTYTISLDSSADVGSDGVGQYYRIDEGTTESFEAIGVFTPETDGLYQMRIENIHLPAYPINQIEGSRSIISVDDGVPQSFYSTNYITLNGTL